MNAKLKQVLAWIEERTGLPSAIHHFLDEDIPASAGWHQVMGSVAMFAFLCQVVSGLLMAGNYAPTPGEAWDSLRYIVTQVQAGSWVRSLHHWGASAMIIVVVLHMIQVFIWGAYKKPRETTWMVGVVLLLLTMAFGLSGYLLAWDNRAYWGTMVTTQITKLAPGGALILAALGTDGNAIGRVTFSRFYAAHVTLLPLLTGLLVVLHLYLVRRHGVTPVPGDDHRPKKKFFPEQVYKDTVATFLWFVCLGLMCAFVKVPLGHAADPTDTSFIPRPEWYFLFLFQMLKVFSGSMEVFGAVILPGLAVGALLLTPFIDRGAMKKVQNRTGAILLVVFAAIGWTALTARAVQTTPPIIEDESTADIEPWQMIPAAHLAGIGAFRQGNCASCHILGRNGLGPDLTKYVSVKPPEWITDHIKKPTPDAPESTLNGAQVRNLIALVTKRSPVGVEAWATAPDSAIAGATLYMNRQCALCHDLNGEGGKQGPSMNGLRVRHDKAWVEGHFADPPKFSPGSTMPKYAFNVQDLETITSYIMAIPK